MGQEQSAGEGQDVGQGEGGGQGRVWDRGRAERWVVDGRGTGGRGEGNVLDIVVDVEQHLLLVFKVQVEAFDRRAGSVNLEAKDAPKRLCRPNVSAVQVVLDLVVNAVGLCGVNTHIRKQGIVVEAYMTVVCPVRSHLALRQSVPARQPCWLYGKEV